MTPIFRVWDTETTGIDPVVDQIVEIGWTDIEGGKVSNPGSLLVNPGRTIPSEASSVHHIIDSDVATSPMLPQAIAWAMESLPDDGSNVVYAAHVAKFDRSFLPTSMVGDNPWICTHKCALRLWPAVANHKNQTLRYALNPEGLSRELAEPSHRAGPDAYVTAHILREMLKLASVEQLIQWSNEPALLVTCYFKAHKGKPWRDVPADYLEWILRQRDMDEDVRFTAQHHINQGRKHVIEAMGL